MSTSEDSVNEELGLDVDGSTSDETSQDEKPSELPDFAKAKIGKMEKRHARELRAVREELAQLRAHTQPQSQPNYSHSPSYSMDGVDSGEDERIQRAIQMALSHKEREQAEEHHKQNQAHVASHYQDFARELEDAADEHDDFEDVTQKHSKLYTPEMMTVASIIPSRKLAAQVVYHLGKNPEDLKRINSLHPLDQGKELMKIAFSLHAGDKAKSAPSDDGILSNLKTNSSSVTSGKNSSDFATIRRRMREGSFK